MAAAECGARGVGIDIDPARIAEANAGAREHDVQHVVSFTRQNVMAVDVSPATVVVLYVGAMTNMLLRVTTYIRVYEPEARLLLLVARERDARLAAVLPVVRERSLCGLPARKLRAPTTWDCMRFDLPRRAGAVGQAGVRAIWSFLGDRDDWDVIELPDVPSGGAGEALAAQARSCGCPVARDELHLGRPRHARAGRTGDRLQCRTLPGGGEWPRSTAACGDWHRRQRRLLPHQTESDQRLRPRRAAGPRTLWRDVHVLGKRGSGNVVGVEFFTEGHVSVRCNTIASNLEDGILVRNVVSGEITNNHVNSNGRSGIRVNGRIRSNLFLEDNSTASNGLYGIEVADIDPRFTGLVSVVDNLSQDNTIDIFWDGTGRACFVNNTFATSSPPVLPTSGCSVV